MSCTMAPSRMDELVERFHELFPYEQDLYWARGFFQASGLTEHQALAAAETIASKQR